VEVAKVLVAYFSQTGNTERVARHPLRPQLIRDSSGLAGRHLESNTSGEMQMRPLWLRRVVAIAMAMTLAAVALSGLGGCGDFDAGTCQDSWYSSDRVGVVVSLSVPDTIATDEQLQMDLVVLVEPGATAEYRYTRIHRETHYVTVTPVVEVHEYTGSCDPLPLGEPYEVGVHEQLGPPFEEGAFEIRVRQPADSVLVRVVQVVDLRDEGHVATPD